MKQEVLTHQAGSINTSSVTTPVQDCCFIFQIRGKKKNSLGSVKLQAISNNHWHQKTFDKLELVVVPQPIHPTGKRVLSYLHINPPPHPHSLDFLSAIRCANLHSAVTGAAGFVSPPQGRTMAARQWLLRNVMLTEWMNERTAATVGSTARTRSTGRLNT